MEMLMQMFSYPFIVRAFIVGILVSLCAALLGVSLVLKQYSMIGDGLSHVTENGLMKSDAAIAAMSASALAIGVSVTSLTTGMTTDVCSYMFGSILAMTSADVYLSVGLSVIVLLLFIFCYHSIFTVTFDESFARATGVKVSFYNTMIAIFKSVVISSGILAVICFCIGMIVSYQFSTPAGASVVLVNLCAFAIFFVIQKIREHI